MGKPGIIAFPVLLALGAITGYLTYTNFDAAMPQEGIVDSPYRKELTTPSGNETDTGRGEIDESKYSSVVTIKILEGALVQGSPDYDPDGATVKSDALITWLNDDTTLHTATSGTGTSDPESGALFDTKFLPPDGKYSVPAAKIGTGQHSYYCAVHPYMTSTVTIE